MMENKIKKRGLGRGLSALIGNDLEIASKQLEPEKKEEESVQTKEGIQLLDIYQVEPDRTQPRQNFDSESLEELTASVKQYGVLQPLIVQKKDGFYQIIAGERRWRAAKNAGIEKVPVIIKEYGSEETLEISLIENIQREDLSPMEEAKAYKRLIEEYKLKQDEIAEKVGKSRSSVANSLRLLNLADPVQEMVNNNTLSMGHAKVLLSVRPAEKQQEIAKMVVEEGLSVRQLEKLLESDAKRAKKAEVEKQKQEDSQEALTSLIYESIGQQMQDVLGTKVNIIQGKRKGKIEIEYYSPEDLERIMEMINRIKK